jgi:pimeloyl-ACP methyl ester carboxylesterase
MAGTTVCGAVILVLLFLVGLIWLLGSRAKAELAAQFPPPGKLVDVGGYRLHIDGQGDPTGSPTVVLDAGQGEPGLTWASVQPEVSGFARVCSYDRAGLGWSDASPKARTASNIVDEFSALLAQARVRPPYVLVGHSAGAMYMMLYAHAHPEDVVGMVLVDAAHPDLDVRPPESVAKLGRRGSNVMGYAFRFLQALNSIGLLALATGTVSRMWFGPIPDQVRETFIGVACSDTRWFEAARKEILCAWGNLAEARAAGITTLGDIPLIVLSRGLGRMTAGPGISAEDAEMSGIANDEMQAELATLSPKGKQIIAEDSGHYIHIDQPDLVIDAIREVVVAARAQS